MISIPSYTTDFDELVNRVLPEKDAPHHILEMLLKQQDRMALLVVMSRQQLLTQSDRDSAAGLLATGVFRELGEGTRIAAIKVAMELEMAIHRRRLEIRFAKYNNAQLLFKFSPDLLQKSREAELLPIVTVRQFDKNGVVSLGRKFGMLDPMLPVSIVNWMTDNHPDAPLFVRMHPEKVFNSYPEIELHEEVLVPADPKWWNGLAIYPHCRTGAVYYIDPLANPADEPQAYMEYHIKGLRRLETITKRSDKNYLSMMFEELEVRNGLLIGRCIHCDTYALYGTSPTSARLAHLDLAINVYAEQAIELRLTQHLRDGKVVDATFRTHLLRVEDVSAEATIPISFMYFRSRCMLADLVANQFQPSEKSSN